MAAIPQFLKGYAEELGFPESEILFRIFDILYDGQDDIKMLSAMVLSRGIGTQISREEAFKRLADACSGCGECVSRCQFRAITLRDIAEIYLGKCYGCGNCAAVCPTGALILTEFRPIEHIRTSSKVGSLG